MGFGFRIGVPGLGLRVSTRGIRASAGPRIARVSVGSGGARLSSGLGPFQASARLGGGSPRRRTRSPSPARLARAQQQAERARREDERLAAIAELAELHRRTTTAHLEHFPPAEPPRVPEPPPLGPDWALDVLRAHHLRDVPRWARARRAEGTRAAERDAPVHLAAETARLAAVHEQLAAEAAHWWAALEGNDEQTVCAAVNAAFADNPAAGCAVGLDGSVLSVVMRQQDLDTMPTRLPGRTPAGRPTLKAVPKRDQVRWWLHTLTSAAVATLEEGFAVAPGVTAIDLAVLSRLPGTRRLGFVAFGRWTRPAITAGPWRTPEDALRLLDLGQDVACSVTTTPSGNPSTTLRPLPTDRIPGLRHLLGLLQEDEEADGTPDPLPLATLDATLAEPVPTVDRHLESPYRIRPFAVCRLDTAPDPPTAVTDWLRLQFLAGGADADLALLLLDADSRVSGDFDLVFHRQPVGGAGAVRVHGELREGDRRAERAGVDLRGLPDRVRRILIAVGTDAHGGVPLADLHEPLLTLRAPGAGAWRIAVTPDPRAGAETVAELVRETAPGRHRWEVRTIARPWTGGLTALVRAYGIDAD